MHRIELRRSTIVWALCLGTVAGGAAFAADPCVNDMKQFCPDVRPGSGGLIGCLRQHREQISVACRDRLDSDAVRAKNLVETFGRACRGDVEQLCANVPPGGGRVLACLDAHEEELSATCQAEAARISRARDQFSAVKRACEADAQRLCEVVPHNAATLLECLVANEALLSSGCNTTDVRRAVDAASIVDVVAEMTSADRAKEAVAILQGLDSVAFSRSQILLQFDNFDGLGGKANANRLLFNPQFVFGSARQFAFQFKVPVTTLFPYATGAATQSGLGDVVTAFSWGFFATRQIRQYLAVGLQWQTASQPVLGAAWLIQPVYAISVGLARWLSLTSQVSWSRSFASDTYPSMNLLVFEPILVLNLPGRSYLAVDTKLGWQLDKGTFLPVMKGVAGLFLDRQKSLSISAWYQSSLTRDAARETLDFGIGMGLAYFFDW